MYVSLQKGVRRVIAKLIRTPQVTIAVSMVSIIQGSVHFFVSTSDIFCDSQNEFKTFIGEPESYEILEG